jgi:hypothetical protein
MSIWAEKDERLGGSRILQNEELHNLHSSPNKIRMIKSRRMILTRHIAGMGEEECL